MATTVGTESSPRKLIENVMLLEHDAIAAYDETIKRLETAEYRAKVEEFRQDHLGHLDRLKSVADTHGVRPPSEGDIKEMLTTGKVSMADLVGGDSAVLMAMSSNETDTVTAYRQALDNPDLPDDMRSLVEDALSDEQRHKVWMDNAADAA